MQLRGHNQSLKIFSPLGPGALIQKLCLPLIWKNSTYLDTFFFNFVHGISLKNGGKRPCDTCKMIPMLFSVGVCITCFFGCYFWTLGSFGAMTSVEQEGFGTRTAEIDV